MGHCDKTITHNVHPIKHLDYIKIKVLFLKKINKENQSKIVICSDHYTVVSLRRVSISIISLESTNTASKVSVSIIKEEKWICYY